MIEILCFGVANNPSSVYNYPYIVPNFITSAFNRDHTYPTFKESRHKSKVLTWG